jgi:hypothetical protein
MLRDQSSNRRCWLDARIRNKRQAFPAFGNWLKNHQIVAREADTLRRFKKVVESKSRNTSGGERIFRAPGVYDSFREKQKGATTLCFMV